MAQLVEHTLGKGEVPSSNLGISTIMKCIKNSSGGDSAVVPPDPMPNSAVKRRSADGSVGPPHARVGNCQTLFEDEKAILLDGLFAFSEKTNLTFQLFSTPIG